MDLVEVIVAVIAGGLITQLIGVYRARADVRNADRKSAVDESTGAATAAKNITDASATLIKLADDQVDEFRKQIQALQAESSALNTRLDREIEKRLRSEAKVAVLEDEIAKQRNQLAAMGAQFELADKERTALQRENGAMKTKMYEMAVGIQTLTRQLGEAKIEPMYSLEVPVTATGRLGPLDVDAVRQFGG